MRLPLIPLSPYIQTSCEYAKVLAQITKSLSEQQDNANIKSSLEKSLIKEREKLDRLTKSMQTIQSSCLLDFNIYDIAKEIAYINCSLFRMVTLDPTWLCNFDKQSNMVPLLDFHRYLSHSLAHQVIYGDPKKKSVVQLIHLAYVLLHVYRDFSGCTAVLTCLHMPEVRRLESMWAPCPAKLLQVYQELVAMLLPDNNYEAYHHQLWLHTHRFLGMVPSKSQMIAVPFMHAHLAIIQNLVQTHASIQAASDVVLSSAGQPLLASTVQLLEFCQQFSKMDPIDLEQYAIIKNKRASIQSSSSNKRASIISSSNNSKAIKLSTSPCLDLDILRSDANVYHWIVSRAYLTRSQLHAESLHVEPLAVGEIELESEEEHDLYWDFFDKQESVVAAVNKEPPPAKPSQSLKHVDVGKQQQQQDPTQATVDGLNVIDSVDEPSLSSLNPVIDGEHVPTVNESDADEASTDGIKAASTNETINLQDDVDTPAADHVALEDLKDDEVNQPSVEQPTEAPSKSMAKEPVTHDQQTSKEIEEDEPELVQMPADKDEVKAALPERTVTTASMEYNDDDDDDIIILTEEDDEEWTGYPLDSTPSQTVQDTEEEDEEWTGYPFTSQDEEDMAEEEEEVWKGYPIPSSEGDEQQQQQQPQDNDDEARKSPVDLSSSPATPSEEGSELIHRHEEWKGYQKTTEEESQQQQQRGTSEDTQEQQEDHANHTKHHHQLHAIGKAAARRMQYSLSSTDTNRKRLPSPFAPSSST